MSHSCKNAYNEFSFRINKYYSQFSHLLLYKWMLLNNSIMYKFFHKKSTITFNWDLKNCSYNCTNYCWTSYFQIECSEHYKTFSHLYLFNTFGDFFSFVEQQYWCNATVDILVCIPAVVTGSTFPWRSLSTCNTGLLQARECVAMPYHGADHYWLHQWKVYWYNIHLCTCSG